MTGTIPTKPRSHFQTEPWNQPLPRPGIYLLQHLASGRSYVGATKNVAVRINEHRCFRGNVPRLDPAIKALGRESFLAFPLYYSILDAATMHDAGLFFVEKALVEAYDCLNSGFNGELPNITVRARTQAAVAKRRAAETSQETKLKRTNGWKKRKAAPELEEQRQVSIRRAMADPATRERVRIARLGKIWITNGTQTRAISGTDSIPEGWLRGRKVCSIPRKPIT